MHLPPGDMSCGPLLPGSLVGKPCWCRYRVIPTERLVSGKSKISLSAMAPYSNPPQLQCPQPQLQGLRVCRRSWAGVAQSGEVVSPATAADKTDEMQECSYKLPELIEFPLRDRRGHNASDELVTASRRPGNVCEKKVRERRRCVKSPSALFVFISSPFPILSSVNSPAFLVTTATDG